MTTLSASRTRAYTNTNINGLLVPATTTIYAGAAVGVNEATGSPRPLQAGDKFIGFAQSSVNHIRGQEREAPLTVVDSGQVALQISGAVATDIGKDVFATDDDTFTFSSSGGSLVGVAKQLLSAGRMMVEILPPSALNGVRLAPGGTALVSGDGTVIEIGGGGGSSTFAGLSDKTSADIPATNTPTATALGLKAPLASPTFTGTPSAPTAAPGTNTTQLATTEFVLANAGGGSPVLGPYATEAALETAYPAASNSEAFATVGASAPYKLYWSDGNSWILSTARANPLVTIASSGASFTQSAINTSVVDVTLTGNCTIAFSNVPAGAYTVRLILRQDATGSRTVTWPGSVSWDGSGSAPALRSTPGAIDDIELTTVDSGATWIARNLRAQQAANPASYGLTHIRNDGTTTQTLTGSANTKLAAALTTVVSNADGWWDTTNKKFVPTVAGKYLITVGVQTDAASIQAVAQVYKNGAAQGNGNGYGASAYCASQNTQVVTMNGTTDYVEAYVFHSGTAATNNAVDNTYFKALFLGA